MRPIFAEPGWLWLLVLVPLAVVGRIRRGYRRRADWRALGQSSPLYATGSAAWLVATVALVLALAGPRWGRRPGDDPPPGHDLVLLMDVSRSMGAEDAAPDRLTLARASARSLIDPLRDEPGDRVAVVAFAARGVVRCPLTGNLDAADDALDALHPGSVEPGGTDLGAGLQAAVDLLDADAPRAEGRAVVVFSDGEDHAATWADAVARLVAAGAVVHVVAIGDPDQAPPVPALSKTHNPPPTTRRNDAVLRQVAEATGGSFVPLGVSRVDLGALYRDRIRPTARHPVPEPRFSERAERFGAFLSVALGAALLGSRTPRRPRIRPRPRALVRLGPSHPLRPKASLGRRLALALLAALVLLTLCLGADEVGANRAEVANQRGLADFAAGRFPDALAAFEVASQLRPEGVAGHFNAGSALVALDRWEEAEARYTLARARAERSLRPRVDYALGNTCALLGRFAEAVAHYDACLATGVDQPGLVTLLDDARVNREAVLDQLQGGSEPPERDSPRDQNGPEPGNRPRSPDNPGSAADGPEADRPQSAPPSNPGERSPRGTPSRRRGPGGAGGTGPAPGSESPDERLNAALRRIRAAQDQRPPEPPPRNESTPSAAARDW